VPIHDEPHRLLDRPVIGQRKADRGDVVGQRRGDVEIGPEEDDGAPAASQHVADLAQPGDDDIGVAVRLVLQIPAEVPEHEDRFLGQIEDLPGNLLGVGLSILDTFGGLAVAVLASRWRATR
jgi:hypothetical protein